ncbi:hypothetical protein BDP27DRAFT_1414050 [Rhodocollybia butyracea]|uniref:Uncharacterized protein n=1 Tax=Rhodocollybia butyracea TaxID=206335 RepID=A0A9P5QAP4_9AGAR|nr:hypothetical protein BDP27DRAFT_1414050 [Rhodocollybia butyracea]
MVTRLPTHLDALVPPPSLQSPSHSALLRPWRGFFLVSGTRASDLSSNVEIRVTAVETDGDIKSHIWPLRLLFSITVPRSLPILAQLHHYLKSRSPPIPVATFLPERIRDPNLNVVNQTHFRSLSRLLWDSQLVAIVPIDLHDPHGFSDGSHRHGILLYPAANSTSLLIGAVFMTPEDTFPDFVGNIALSGSQSRFGRYGASTSGEASSIPISPTIVHRQNQQRGPQSLRAPTASTSHYHPLSSGAHHENRPSFPLPSHADYRLSHSNYSLVSPPQQFVGGSFGSGSGTSAAAPPPSISPVAAWTSSQSGTVPFTYQSSNQPPDNISSPPDPFLEQHVSYRGFHNRDASQDSSRSRHSE